MLPQICVASALCAVALSAPTLSYAPGAADSTGMKILSEYFTMLGQKVQEGRSMAQAPVCDMSKATLPLSQTSTSLPPISAGLSLKHVAVGRGTQNYSCTAGETATPIALGAVATLYNASCIASTYPDLLAALPNVALQFNLTSANQAQLSPSNLAISGHHFFSNGTTPDFNMDTASLSLGFAPCSKNSSVSAPANASVGQGGKGNGAVAWLKLLTRDGATGNLEEIYRVNTAGGNPPATCAGMPSTFEVQYAAEYWFFESAA